MFVRVLGRFLGSRLTARAITPLWWLYRPTHACIVVMALAAIIGRGTLHAHHAHPLCNLRLTSVPPTLYSKGAKNTKKNNLISYVKYNNQRTLTLYRASTQSASA